MTEIYCRTPAGFYINSDYSSTFDLDQCPNRHEQVDPDFYRKREQILEGVYQEVVTPVINHLTQRWPATTLRILDLGCGAGSLIRGLNHLLTTRGLPMELHGVDLDPVGLRKVNTPSSKLVHADTISLPYQDGSFHAVFSTQVIEHFDLPRLVENLKQIRRVTAEAGLLYIETPNPESWEAKVMRGEWPMCIPEHRILLPPDPLARLLESFGFDVLSAGTRVEVDEQINEPWKIITAANLPGLSLIPWRVKLAATAAIVRTLNAGSITTVLAQKH